MKTKEYIKAHLSAYVGKSFLGSINLIPETPGITESFVITKYSFLAVTKYSFFALYPFHFPCFMRIRIFFDTIKEFFANLIPIIKNAGKTWNLIKESTSIKTVRQASGMKKMALGLRFILLLPVQFIIRSLDRGDYISFYGHPSQLFYQCRSGTFQKTKSPGPAACYCREDVEFLCRKENIRLAKSMKRYYAPEEYFCQTLLYNSPTQCKNFLDENVCATDYHMKDMHDALRYVEPDASGILGLEYQNFKFAHICFLRKVTDPKIYDAIEVRLTNPKQEWHDEET